MGDRQGTEHQVRKRLNTSRLIGLARLFGLVYSKFIVRDESVVDAGPLGVIGAIGWFLPTHILENDGLAPLNQYECTDASFFEYWRSLESPGN